MKKLYALAFAALFTIACGGGDSVTGSSPIPDSGGGFTATSVQPTPSPSPATPSSTPEGDRPYVTFKEPLGEGEFCNTMTHPLVLKVEYWNANNFQKQILLETREFPAGPKKCVPIPPAAEVVKLDCGEKVYLQVDAATTEHLGHVFVTLVGPEEKETVNTVVTYSEWSACSSPAGADVKEGCFKTRTKTTTTTKTYVCKPQVVEVVTVEEKESCTCACVETWVELKPEVTKGEWGACTSNGEGCFQSREVTTIIKEQNSCTQEIRQKSKVVTTEKKECTCACVEEWKELKPEVTYTEWSECSKPSDRDIFEGCSPEKCYQTRMKITVVKEQNSCTEEVRVKSRTEEKEQKECECKIEQTCANTPASSSASNPFELDNAGDATELAWVNSNVQLGPWKQIAKKDYRHTCEYSDYDAKVVLVKSSDKWGYVLNVKKGDKLCSFAKNKHGQLQDISHITYYNCK